MSYNLNKRPKESKKWIMTLLGVSGVMFIYISGSVLVMLVPLAAQYIVSLATSAITFLSSLTLLYAGAQATVEYATINKNVNVAETINEKSDKTMTIIEQKKSEFAEKYRNDNSYAPTQWVEKNETGEVWR